MKLATIKGGRDGKLVVVSRDLSIQVEVPSIARTLQMALDDWQTTEPRLLEVYEKLNAGLVESQPFDAGACHSPLPRAYQWIDGSGYINHVELVRKARGADMPPSFWTDPLIYQGGSDSFAAPRDPIIVVDEGWGVDLEAEITAIVGDVTMGTSVEQALVHLKLLMLVNDVTLRNLTASELAKGFGFFQSKPASAFSPVAVTPDELGEAWRDGKVHLPLRAFVNGKSIGTPNAGVDMTFNFARFIAHAARTRDLCAGSIIGAGTVSNRDRAAGVCCLAESRALETIEFGEPRTPFLRFGDRVRIEMLDGMGQSVFGAIEQTVERCP